MSKGQLIAKMLHLDLPTLTAHANEPFSPKWPTIADVRPESIDG
jgi:hypothetical protein